MDIKVGDKVLSYNEKNKKKELKTVKNIFRNKTNKWVHLFAEINELEEEMRAYAKELNFEMAAQIRDAIIELKAQK